MLSPVFLVIGEFMRPAASTVSQVQFSPSSSGGPHLWYGRDPCCKSYVGVRSRTAKCTIPVGRLHLVDDLLMVVPFQIVSAS